MKYKGVIFDLDDTIWDFKKNSISAIAFVNQEFNKRYSLLIPEIDFITSYQTINNKLWDEYQKGERESQSISYTRFLLVAKKYGLDIGIIEAKNIAQLYLDKLYGGEILMPHVREVLDYLVDDYKIGLLTNGFSKGLIRLKNCDLEKYFSFVITSQMYGKPKPDIGIFQYVADNLALAYQDCIFIGDNYDVDIVGAKKAGFSTIFYNVHNRKLSEHETMADYIINSLEEVYKIL